MDYKTFKQSIKNDSPPDNCSDTELAMWYALNNNWLDAHKIAQTIKNDLGSWIHAYLHRLEGDLGNANYWYQRANKQLTKDTLDCEAEKIIRFITNIRN